VIELKGKKFYLAHGDGLDLSDKRYLLLKKLFSNKLLQYLFARLHPNFAFWLGQSWSRESRLAGKRMGENFKGAEKEGMYLYSKKILDREHVDYFVYGHRHIMVNKKIGNNSRYINLGNWIDLFSYGVFDGDNFELKQFKKT
jgi:UDP-2,3-diacylglucosamine hydrolase